MSGDSWVIGSVVMVEDARVGVRTEVLDGASVGDDYRYPDIEVTSDRRCLGSQ